MGTFNKPETQKMNFRCVLISLKFTSGLGTKSVGIIWETHDMVDLCLFDLSYIANYFIVNVISFDIWTNSCKMMLFRLTIMYFISSKKKCSLWSSILTLFFQMFSVFWLRTLLYFPFTKFWYIEIKEPEILHLYMCFHSDM